jgi:hypothetical protein
MTLYTYKGNYPYPDPTDTVTSYPSVAATFASYLDNLPNRSRIINGCFDVWQRGTSFSSPATGTYTADRWRLAYDGAGGTRVISQVAGAASFPGGMFPKYVMQIAISNRGTATTQTISQRIEDARTFAAEYITISAYVRTTSGTLNVGVKSSQNYGTGGSPSASVTTTHGTFTATTTWQRLSYTAQLGAAGGTFGTNGDDNLEILFDLGVQTGTLQLWGVQVEQGVTRTALERRPIGQELALCQRYYETSYTSGITPGTDGLTVNQTGGFVHYAANSAGGYVSYAVRKRSLSHSVSLWAPLNTPSANKARRSFDGTTQAAAASFTTEIGFNTSITGGTNDQYQIGWAASAEL